MKIRDLGEFGWIGALARDLDRDGEGVVRGVGDDAAVLDVGGDRLLLATCDCQIEGVHFASGRIDPRRVGRRAAAVSLSDVAAMGGEPRWALASIAVPPDEDVERLEEIYEGLVDELTAAGAALVGGNTARSADGLAIDLFVLGQVERGQLLLRSGARPGDAICATGDLGASLAGLLLLEAPSIDCDVDVRARLAERHLAPRARIAEGRALGAAGGVTACIDVSDGLVADAGHLAEQSGVTIRIDAARVPISADVEAAARALSRDPLELALGGGEDFELLFAVDAGHVDRVLELLQQECGTPARRIGRATEGPAQVIVERDGTAIDIAAAGFDHFRR